MKLMYYVTVDAKDGCNISTMPCPVTLEKVSDHIKHWLGQYQLQGYYKNANCFRLSMSEISFRLEPVLTDDEGEPLD